MSGLHSDNWSERIGVVFDIHPRVAETDISRWMERKEEKKLRSALVRPGLHVCLYGPTGSGKTSLAKTILARLKNKGQKFIFVRLNHNSSWSSFKSQILENKQSRAASEKSFGVKIGIKNLLPYIELEGDVAGGSLGKQVSRASIVDSLDIHHISQFLVDNNLMLAIDDSNFANDDLLLKLTTLARELSDSSEHLQPKIFFIGHDDIYLRILELNNSLRDRMEGVSLGSVREDDEKPSIISKDRVWKFIADGLVELGLKDPRKDSDIDKEQLIECVEWINHAADGLPKSIVILGQKIAEAGERRTRISYKDIISASEIMTKRNFKQFRSKYRTLVYSLRNNETLQEVCLWMFERGASRVYEFEELAEDLHLLGTYSHFEEAIEELRCKDFLIVTGINKEIFFAKDPLLAHTIGVALLQPDKCGVDKNFFGGEAGISQLLLRFSGEKDPENRKKI